ncbi:hypothetical protein Tco_0281035 [Tanacetum coccineum]
MAIGSFVSSEVRKHNGRITSFLVLSCMVAASGGIDFGYDVGISDLEAVPADYVPAGHVLISADRNRIC